MALPENDFTQLKDMQVACTQVEADARTLRDMVAAVESIRARYQSLSESYQADWQRLADDEKLSPSQRQQEELDSMVAEGGYSVLGQDTIWNALEDVRSEIGALQKALAIPLD